jgi:branched-chain amino acid transport system ATP-binding protein
LGLLTVNGVIAGYSGADQILKGIDFAVEDKEIVCIVGPNGAGKSTLLKTIAGLLVPSAGSIALQGKAGQRAVAGCAGAPRYRLCATGA